MNTQELRERVDTAALVRAIAAVEAEIRPLKQRLRTTWPEGAHMAPVQHELIERKRRATALLVLRARLRGRYHLLRAPLDAWGERPDRETYHAELATETAREFVRARPRASARPAARVASG